jgi:TolA-binding protein
MKYQLISMKKNRTAFLQKTKIPHQQKFCAADFIFVRGNLFFNIALVIIFFAVTNLYSQNSGPSKAKSPVAPVSKSAKPGAKRDLNKKNTPPKPNKGAKAQIRKNEQQKILRARANAIKERNKLVAEYRLVTEAVKQFERTLSQYPDQEFTPVTMFQLSQLYIKKEKIAYAFELEKYEKKLALLDKGLLKTEPDEPQINYQPSIEVMERLLNEHPDIEFLENAMYWYGLCLFDASEREKAAEVFQQLLEKFPETTYADEIKFRIGENFFDLQNYPKALEFYSNSIDKWNNPYFGMALYKLAWSQYKQDDYSSAVSTFFYLLGDLDLIDSLKLEEFGRTKLDLRDESIEYLAISFNEIGGLEVVNNFFQDIKAPEKYKIRVSHSMADVYRNRSYFEQAADIYKDILRQNPKYEKAPQVQYGIFDCYDKLDMRNQAMEARKNLILNYNSKSVWGKAHRDAESQKMVNAMVQQADFILATPLLTEAEQALTSQDKDKAVELLRQFIENFPRDERAPRAAFNLAETYFELGNYRMAAKIYQIVLQKFPKSQFIGDAAYNRVICYDQLFQNEKETVPDTIKFANNGKKVLILTKSAGQKEFLQACNEYTKIIPNSEKTVEILLKSAEQFFNLEQLKITRTILNRAVSIITRKSQGRKYYAQIASLLAQTCYKLENFKEAEKWYGVASKFAADSANLRDVSKKMMASSRYKIAENLMAGGDSLKAAQELEKIAIRYGGSEVAEVATYDAAVQFEKAGQDAKAAKLFELFSTRYPNSENLEKACLRAAVLYEKSGKEDQAAQNFMKVYQRNRNSEFAAGALFSAAQAYERSKKWTLASSAYRKYYQEYLQEDPKKIFEAVFKDAFATFESKNLVAAQGLLQNTINYSNQLRDNGVQFDEYFVAQAYYLMAEIDFRFFVTIKLLPPLEANMQKKQMVLNALLQKYLEATKYKIADWTTASFYKIGQAFESFAQSVIESPIPEEATVEQIEQYKQAIRARLVFPLWEKAIEYYQGNLKLSQESNIQNEWVEKSRVCISKLQKELSGSPTASAK